MDTRILIVFFTFCILCCGTATALLVQSPTGIPTGDLVPGTKLTIETTITKFTTDSETTFPASDTLQFYTDLNSAKWDIAIVLNGIGNPRPLSTGRTNRITGFELSYPSDMDLRVRVSLEGVVPEVSKTSDLEILRIRQLDSSDKIRTDGEFVVTRTVIKAGEVQEAIASAKTELDGFQRELFAAKAAGTDTAAAERKVIAAQIAIEDAEAAGENYQSAQSHLTIARSAIVDGEALLQEAIDNPLVNLTESPDTTRASSDFAPESWIGSDVIWWLALGGVLGFGVLIIGILAKKPNKKQRSITQQQERRKEIALNDEKVISRGRDRVPDERPDAPKRPEKLFSRTVIEDTFDTNIRSFGFTTKFPPELRSRYDPLEFIGEGGFASVFKVRRKSDGQIVAVKIPRIDEKTSSIFIKEVAAWYHLSHKNIVKLYSSDILPIPHLEMEYIDGIEADRTTCRDLDALEKPVPLHYAVQIIIETSRGLSYAHKKGIYHLDLKPLNVLITSENVPKIADFGLSRVSARSSITTNKGYTPLYAAPEQLDHALYGNPDHRTDLYLLGMIFFELITGKLPYDGSSPGVIIGKVVSGSTSPATLASIDPDLAIYDPIVGRLIAKRMEDRFQSAEEFQLSLQSVFVLNNERKELLEDLKLTKESLRFSTRNGDIQRLTREAIRKSIRIALLHAQLNDRIGLITALDEIRLLKTPSVDDMESLDDAIDQVQYMIAEDLPLGSYWIDQLRILLGKIELQG